MLAVQSTTRQRELVAGAFFYFDVEALDLLVQSGQGDLEVLGGFCLVPVATFEAIRDNAALDLFHEVEEAGIGLVVEQAGRVGASGELRR